MLAQVISKAAYGWPINEETGPERILFGTIVCVVKLDKLLGKATILHEEMLYRISLNLLEFVSSETDMLSWDDIKKREDEKKQQIIDSIENFVVE